MHSLWRVQRQQPVNLEKSHGQKKAVSRQNVTWDIGDCGISVSECLLSAD